MSLLDRLLGLDGEKIPVHSFEAAANEYRRGHVTAQQVKFAFNLSDSELSQARIILELDPQEMHDLLMLGETGHYTKEQIKARLGV